MNRDEALERIREVTRIVERTTMYTLLPGAAAIIGGALVLAGCAVSYAMLRPTGSPWDFQGLTRLTIPAQWAFCCMWAGIGAAAIVMDVVLTARKARALGLQPAARPARFAAYSLCPSLVVAVALTIEFMRDPQLTNIRYVASVWMMCYGVGVYTAGLLSVTLPRLLGLAFIAMGVLATSFLKEYGVVMAALSFGVLHIVFGAIVLSRRDSTE